MQILFGTLAYIIISFPLAVVWHMKLFRARYIGWQYFGADMRPVLGLAAMVVQGVLLSCGYAILHVEHLADLKGLLYALLMGLFLWSAHVLATMGKNSKLRNFGFFWLETAYLILQFGLYGLAISYIF